MMYIYTKNSKFIEVFLIVALAVLFHPFLASKIALFFFDYFYFYPFIYLYELPSSWFFDNPTNRMVLLAIMSFSPLFIAPLNSFSNTIKDGNLLQVNYVREKFNYNIIARYLGNLTSALLVQNFLFSIFCLCFILLDILIFYKRYTNFLFYNTNVLTNFLSKKIRQENKARKFFFEAFEEMKKNINRFEKKYYSQNQNYNSSLTLKTNTGVQELETIKFRGFLHLINHYLNYEKKEIKKTRYFSTRVLFNLQYCQVTLSVDFIDSSKELEKVIKVIKQKLEKRFIGCFEYIDINKKENLIPHLTENLDIHFFDLYQKNEFKSLFTNIDLLREAISKTDLKVGEGVYEILYFFSKITLQYPEMNKIISFNNKIYNLWLAVFEKTLELDSNVIEFAFKNLAYAIEQKFITEDYCLQVKKDLYTIIKQKELDNEVLFSLCYSIIHAVIYLQERKISQYQSILEILFFFDKEIFFRKNIELKEGIEQVTSNILKEGLLLLASYYFHQKQKKLALQIFTYLEDNFFFTFIFLMRNQERVRRWKWADWFKGEYFQDTTSSSRFNLINCILNFILDRIKKQKDYSNITQLEYQEEDINCLQKILFLLGNKNQKLQKVLLERMYQALSKKQVHLKPTRVQEFIHCCKIGYASVMKLSDILKHQIKNGKAHKFGYKFQIQKQIFLKNEYLKLEDFEIYGEDLAILENKNLKRELKKKLSISNTNYKDFFQEILIDNIQKPEIEIVFFGDFHKFTRFFDMQEQKNFFQTELTLTIPKKKRKMVYSAFYVNEIVQPIYIVNYQSQKKVCYFLPDNGKKGLDVLFYHKKDNLEVHYYKIIKDIVEGNLMFHYIDHKINIPTNNYKYLKQILYNQQINTKQIEQKIFSTEVECELNIDTKISFIEKEYLSCMYHLTR